MTHHFSHYYSRRCRRMVSELPGVIGPSNTTDVLVVYIHNVLSSVKLFSRIFQWHSHESIKMRYLVSLKCT